MIFSRHAWQNSYILNVRWVLRYFRDVCTIFPPEKMLFLCKDMHTMEGQTILHYSNCCTSIDPGDITAVDKYFSEKFNFRRKNWWKCTHFRCWSSTLILNVRLFFYTRMTSLLNSKNNSSLRLKKNLRKYQT